jgi:dihydropyrimidinase
MTEPAPGEPVRPDDFESGTRAAVAGGITTVGSMAHQWVGGTLQDAIDREVIAARGRTLTDFFVHPVLNDPTSSARAEIADLERTGQPSVKVFMSFRGFDDRVEEYLEAFREAGRHGVRVLVHCEDGALIRRMAVWLVEDGMRDAGFYPRAHPVGSEVAAVTRAIEFARAADVSIYVVHLGSADALDVCRSARARGQRIAVETRPMYLHLTRETLEASDGARYVGNPPVGGEGDRVALWEGLAAGDVDTVCSDHAPWTLEQKLDPTRDVSSFLPGVADLETLMPMLFSEGVRAGKLSFERFVEVTSTGAARLFGLYPTKGVIAEGSDADLGIWNPRVRRRIDGARMQSRAGYSVYDGWDVHGWPVVTVSRGEVVWAEGDVQGAPGRGRLLARSIESDAGRDRRDHHA